MFAKKIIEKIVEGLQKPTWMVGHSTSDLSELLDILEFAEGAIMDAILSEGGLDGDDGLSVLSMISYELKRHGRTSTFDQADKKEV